MRIYISGPMSGHENHNYPAFHEAANQWRAEGFDVLCPAENFGGSTEMVYDVYMRTDLVLVSIADGIAMLNGWEKSKGALCELHCALTLGLPVYDAETMEQLNVTSGQIGFIMWRKWLRENSFEWEDEVWQDDTSNCPLS